MAGVMKYRYITGFIKQGVFVEVRRGMEDAARLLGVEAELTGTEQADYTRLNQMIYDSIEQKYDGLAINLSDPHRFNEAIGACIRAEIPVVSFNIDSKSSKRMSKVCQDFYEAGKSLGRKLIEKIPPFSSVLFTQHTEGQSALDERLAGIQMILDEKNIKSYTVIAGQQPEKAKEIILEVLREYRDISWIIGTGQSDTHGAGLAARALPERGLKVAGFDICEEIADMIREGIILYTVSQEPYIQGFYPLMMLHQYNTMGIHPFDIDTGCRIIDKSQLQEEPPGGL